MSILEENLKIKACLFVVFKNCNCAFYHALRILEHFTSRLKLQILWSSLQGNFGIWRKILEFGRKFCLFVSGLEIRILEPGTILPKMARKLLVVYFFVHKFIWEPGAFHHPAGANLLFCSCYFKACFVC